MNAMCPVCGAPRPPNHLSLPSWMDYCKRTCASRVSLTVRQWDALEKLWAEEAAKKAAPVAEAPVPDGMTRVHRIR